MTDKNKIPGWYKGALAVGGVVLVLILIPSSWLQKSDNDSESPIAGVTVVDYGDNSSNDANTDEVSDLDELNSQIAKDNEELGIVVGDYSNVESGDENELSEILEERGTAEVSPSAYTFMETLQSSELDFSWYVDVTPVDLDDSCETLSIDAQEVGWNGIIDLIAKSDNPNDTIVFENMTFIAYLDEGRSLALCEISGDTSQVCNLVVFADMYGDSGYDYASGNKAVFAGYTQNMKTCEVNGVDILFVAYSTNPYR